ncbi:endonuclease/exonuclease/phosphatase family protein [Streptomyces iconiensis]|uniref:Endonuclease/exonuclease/phosphatase family protein n=1 Tax=Streptomyces iconiensis TaxID=1384038 RepID=A0ABT6ZSZ4_9ACTN|nr:endonuclease/exonuclease/phosphatase family protein [Streptomyces iconiensis]MDJ1132188.1 endonuclease/exonuclease/phosphatase family protein [Streptomyces iconiensis]
MAEGRAGAVRGTLRVMTVNVLERTYADWDRRRHVLARGIESWRPDIVALQEVVGEGDHDGTAELLGGGWQLVAHPRWSASGVGAVLASRWPLGAVRATAFPDTGRTEAGAWRGLTVVEVRAPGPFGTVLIAHHKPSWPRGYEAEREAQAVMAARLIDSMAGSGHVVLLGDFDAAPDAASVRFWTGRQSLDGVSVCYLDAWAAAHPDEPGHTFSPANPLVRRGDMPEDEGRRIDYVMVRCGDHGPTLHVTRCERVFAEAVDGVWASDHYGLVADLVPPAHPPGSWRDRG